MRKQRTEKRDGGRIFLKLHSASSVLPAQDILSVLRIKSKKTSHKSYTIHGASVSNCHPTPSPDVQEA